MTPNFTDNLALELKKALLWFGSLKKTNYEVLKRDLCS